jgi:hypothetical protein
MMTIATSQWLPFRQGLPIDYDTWRTGPSILFLGTCTLQGVNPWSYLTWALPRLAAATQSHRRRIRWAIGPVRRPTFRGLCVLTP